MPTFKVGERVVHSCHGVDKYNGVIATVIKYDADDDTYHIRFDDGKLHWCFECFLSEVI